VAAHEVRLKGGDPFVKVRSPVWVVVWTVLTLGIYGAYWWYQVNRELRDLGRVHGRPELGDSPGTSLLAVTLGALVIVPPFVSLYRGCQRVRAAQELAGVEERDRLNGWIALMLVVVGFLLVFVPLIIAFVQSELNKVWRSPGMTDDPAGVLTMQSQRPTIPPAVPPPPAPPPPGQPAAGQPGPAAPVPTQAEPAPAATTATEADPQLDRLERLAALRDSGALTPDEYEAQKARILEEL
jgi:Domain of unknown function (DUF4234)/Short C-terminal domain